jgi:hypothetical protein
MRPVKKLRLVRKEEAGAGEKGRSLTKSCILGLLEHKEMGGNLALLVLVVCWFRNQRWKETCFALCL